MGLDDCAVRMREIVRRRILGPAGSPIVVWRICQWALNAVCLLFLQATQAWSDETWNQFRGPNGSGVANQATPPIDVTAERLAWSTNVPRGKSSPIIVGSRLFLTATAEDRLLTLAIIRTPGGLSGNGKFSAPPPAERNIPQLARQPPRRARMSIVSMFISRPSACWPTITVATRLGGSHCHCPKTCMGYRPRLSCMMRLCSWCWTMTPICPTVPSAARGSWQSTQ